MGMNTAFIPIRAAQSQDRESAIALYKHLNPTDTYDVDVSKAVWQRMLATDGLTVLVGEVDGRPVTTCTLLITPNLSRGGRPYALIENVVTHSDFRKQGYGSAILAAAVERAKQVNCYKVALTTGSKREDTLRFYEDAGFNRASKTAFEIRLP